MQVLPVYCWHITIVCVVGLLKFIANEIETIPAGMSRLLADKDHI